MKVQNISYSYNFNIQEKTFKNPSFKSNICVETVKHYNIGMMPNGFVGKVKVFKNNGEETFLNLFKHANSFSEIYKLKDDLNNEIGSIELKLRKYDSNNVYGLEDTPSHVFIDELRNYSRRGTPYYTKGLDEYKAIGLRLVQIAQRRSDETGLNGNIELISKNESLGFYEKLGFKRYPFLSPFINPNKMYLPPESKEPLSKMSAGL